jgi:exodeoxyribonuclease VII small subunit
MTADKETFEIALKGLEAAVQRLEAGDQPLEEALACFEEGVKAVSRCQELLNQAELRVEQLMAGSDGKPVLTPFARSEKESEE